MKKLKTSAAFTLIELLVVISIIAILAGIALPVFGEVMVRGNQTKALSNAKQVATACKLWAMDYQGNFPCYQNMTPSQTGAYTQATASDSSNVILAADLIPDYLGDKSVFSIPKSAYCQHPQPVSSTTLVKGENEWAYVCGLTDTSFSRWPLLADGFTSTTPADLSGGATYNADDSTEGGVWKGKKAIVIRVDMSGAVETLFKPATAAGGAASAVKATVKMDTNPTLNAFTTNQTSDPPWLTGTSTFLLNPIP